MANGPALETPAATHTNGNGIRVTLPDWATKVLKDHGPVGLLACALIAFLYILLEHRIPEMIDRFLSHNQQQRQEFIQEIGRIEAANRGNLDRVILSHERESDKLVRALERLSDALQGRRPGDFESSEPELIPFLPRTTPRPKG